MLPIVSCGGSIALTFPILLEKNEKREHFLCLDSKAADQNNTDYIYFLVSSRQTQLTKCTDEKQLKQHTWLVGQLTWSLWSRTCLSSHGCKNVATDAQMWSGQIKLDLTWGLNALRSVFRVFHL